MLFILKPNDNRRGAAFQPIFADRIQQQEKIIAWPRIVRRGGGAF
jgi:hypothetical protein